MRENPVGGIGYLRRLTGILGRPSLPGDQLLPSLLGRGMDSVLIVLGPDVQLQVQRNFRRCSELSRKREGLRISITLCSQSRCTRSREGARCRYLSVEACEEMISADEIVRDGSRSAVASALLTNFHLLSLNLRRSSQFVTTLDLAFHSDR